MSDEPDPPRKVYGFKPREFERANPARPESPDANSPAPDPGIEAAGAGKIDINDLIRAGAGTGPKLGNNATVNRANDVHAILRQNHEHANATGLNELAPKTKRKSKRKRDYWLLFFGVNAFFILAFKVQPVFAGAGIILFNISLTWIMWFVMDDY